MLSTSAVMSRELQRFSADREFWELAHRLGNGTPAPGTKVRRRRMPVELAMEDRYFMASRRVPVDPPDEWYIVIPSYGTGSWELRDRYE